MVHIWMMLPQKSVCNNRSFVQCSCISALSSKLIHDLLLADNVCWHHPTPNQNFYALCSPEQTELKNREALKKICTLNWSSVLLDFFPHSFSRWLNCAYTGSPFESKNSSLVKIFVKKCATFWVRRPVKLNIVWWWCQKINRGLNYRRFALLVRRSTLNFNRPIIAQKWGWTQIKSVATRQFIVAIGKSTIKAWKNAN